MSKPDYLLIRDQLLESTRRESDPNRRVIAICRQAEEMRRRPGQDEAIKRACFHACVEAMRAGRGAVERKKE
ncbi:MAG: hypothetical protein HPY89_00470 [Pelotomaculum sp.]|nr:hypothetical protein [Pelotomaculum sp.]